MEDHVVCDKIDLRELMRKSVIERNPEFRCNHPEHQMIRLSKYENYGCTATGYVWVYFCRACRHMLVSEYWFKYDGEPVDSRLERDHAILGHPSIYKRSSFYNHRPYTDENALIDESLDMETEFLKFDRTRDLKTYAARSFSKSPVFVCTVSNDTLELLEKWLWYFKFRV